MTASDRSTPSSVGSVLTACAGAGLVVAAWRVVGPSHVLFPVLVTCLWFGLAALVGPGLATVLPRRWALVSAAEVRRHRRLAVHRLDRSLEAVGWNRAVRSMRGGTGPVGRQGLRELERHVLAAMTGHGAAAVVHLMVSLACLVAGAPGSAGVIAAAGVLLHGWPVLLQRSTLARIHRVPGHRPAGGRAAA